MIHEASSTFTSDFAVNDYITSDYPSMLDVTTPWPCGAEVFLDPDTGSIDP